MNKNKDKTSVETETEFHVSYGGRAPAERKTKILTDQDKALELFRSKEKDFHVSVEKVERTITTKRTRLV